MCSKRGQIAEDREMKESVFRNQYCLGLQEKVQAALVNPAEQHLSVRKAPAWKLNGSECLDLQPAPTDSASSIRREGGLPPVAMKS